LTVTLLGFYDFASMNRIIVVVLALPGAEEDTV